MDEETPTTDERQVHDPVAEMMQVAPPTVSGMVTAFGAEVVAFPLFLGGKAIELQILCGPLQCRFRVDPEFADTLCEHVQAAAREARSGLQAASLSDIGPVAKAAGKA